MNPIHIREGKPEDLPEVLKLIRELATFERAPEQVIVTVADLERDGFGTHPSYGLFVGEIDGVIAGIAIYYYRYSTWKGRRMYLEDIVVTERHRGKGLGKMLFDRIMLLSEQSQCSGMVWQVLDWNEPAIDFYTKYGSTITKEWCNCSLESSQIREILRLG